MDESDKDIATTFPPLLPPSSNPPLALVLGSKPKNDGVMAVRVREEDLSEYLDWVVMPPPPYPFPVE